MSLNPGLLRSGGSGGDLMKEDDGLLRYRFNLIAQDDILCRNRYRRLKHVLLQRYLSRHYPASQS